MDEGCGAFSNSVGTLSNVHGDTEQNLRREELARYFYGIFQRGVCADKTFDVGYRFAVL